MEKVGPYENCMKAQEAADYLHVGITWFWNNYKELKIPHIRIAGNVWFLGDSLDQWFIEYQKTQNTPFRFHPGAPVAHGGPRS